MRDDSESLSDLIERRASALGDALDVVVLNVEVAQRGFDDCAGILKVIGGDVDDFRIGEDFIIGRGEHHDKDVGTLQGLNLANDIAPDMPLMQPFISDGDKDGTFFGIIFDDAEEDFEKVDSVSAGEDWEIFFSVNVI